MISDSERREIAERLRELADANEGHLGMNRMNCVLRDGQAILGTSGLASVADVLRRHADLIDRPTCRNIGGEDGTNGEHYDFFCSVCGFASGVTDPKYCPNCGKEVVE